MNEFLKVLCLLLLLLNGCGSDSNLSKTLKISFSTHPHTMDPRKAGDFISSTLICLIYEGLTRCLPGGSVEPALAKQTEISSDQKVYTFHLRKASWSDGKPITAYDFEKSWKNQLSPPSVCAYLLYSIKNAEKCAKGEADLDQVGITALDERTLRVELERPTPYFYSLTAFPSLLPVPSHIQTFDNGLIHSGPFSIERNIHNFEISLVKNPHYWNRREVHLDGIHISIVPDEMTALQMFEQGELDWLGGPLSPLPPDAYEKIKNQVLFIPTAASTLCTFNTETFPFHNRNLRKAFSYAIDRDEIVDKMVHSKNHTSSFLPPSLMNHPFSLSNIELAKSHFKKALEELNIEPAALETLTLYYKTSQVEKRLAQTLQRQWKETLGITIELVQLDFKSHASKLQQRDYEISLATWIAQFDDPLSILERFKDKANLKNYPGWENEKYESFLENGKLQEALTLFVEELPLTPIYHWSSPVIASSRVQATATTPCGGILFERFRL